MMKRCCFGFCVRRACSAAEEGVASQRLNGGLHPSAPTRKEPLNAAVLSSWLLVPGFAPRRIEQQLYPGALEPRWEPDPRWHPDSTR
jgi:hypothetical protein